MIIKALTKNFFLFGLSIGLALGFLLAVLFSGIEWWNNYSGLFRDASGTNWEMVYETALSWFLPTLLFVAPLAAGGHLLFGFVKKRKNPSERISTDSYLL